MRNWILAVVFVAAVFPVHGLAQSKVQLVGSWKLVSSTDMTDEGEVKDSYGPSPTGLLTYTAAGRMMALITNRGRAPLSVPDQVSAPAAERAEAFATLVAYAGRYTLAGDRVIHHVEVAAIQNRVNTDLTRYIVQYDGNRITLRTPPYMRGGVQIKYQDLVWERIEP
jgi:hypothetical protein